MKRKSWNIETTKKDCTINRRKKWQLIERKMRRLNYKLSKRPVKNRFTKCLSWFGRLSVPEIDDLKEMFNELISLVWLVTGIVNNFSVDTEKDRQSHVYIKCFIHNILVKKKKYSNAFEFFSNIIRQLEGFDFEKALDYAKT